MKTKFIKPLIICVVVGAVLIGGFIGYKKFFSTATPVSNTRQITSMAQKTNMQVKIQGTGSVYAGISKDLTTNTSGTLKDLNVKIGQTVTTGTNLFTVDSDTLRQNITTAENNLQKQKLTLASAKSDNEIALDNIAVTNAQTQLNNANDQLTKATVSSPIDGVITAINNTNGDALQSGKAVATVVDPSSMKVKVSVDESKISKVKVGQSAEITFNALDGKTYQGTVDTVAEIGNTTNNSTNYDVVVSITNPTDIKIGMNANVSILVASKDNALVVPKEALIEQNGKKFVMTSNSSSSSEDTSTQKSNSSNNQGTQNRGQNRNANSQGNQNSSYRQGSQNSNTSSLTGKLTPVITGLEDEDYIEITEGIQEGSEIIINLPSTTSSSSNSNNKNSFSNMGGLSRGIGGSGNGNSNRQQSGNQGN